MPFYELAKSLAGKFDRFFGSSIQISAGRFYRYLLIKWSSVRRITDPIAIKLHYKTGLKLPEELRLHLGCGAKHFDKYINVDIRITDATDVICNISRLPWPNNSASVIESYHVLEHIIHRKARETLAEWYRVLIPGGKLIIECPHFDEAVREYLEGNNSRLINIFGMQRYNGDIHFFGYNPARLTHLLEEIGFDDVENTQPQSSQTLNEPAFRLECVKKSRGKLNHV